MSNPINKKDKNFKFSSSLTNERLPNANST